MSSETIIDEQEFRNSEPIKGEPQVSEEEWAQLKFEKLQAEAEDREKDFADLPDLGDMVNDNLLDR